MRKKICFAIDALDLPIDPQLPTASKWIIRLIQTGANRFTVDYGAQTTKNLTYAAAAQELGESLMHALACGGKLDNTY
jgi:hypothetical protein